MTKTRRPTTKAQHAITLLKERRTALISAAVTGKIDVRDEEASFYRTGKCFDFHANERIVPVRENIHDRRYKDFIKRPAE